MYHTIITLKHYFSRRPRRIHRHPNLLRQTKCPGLLKQLNRHSIAYHRLLLEWFRLQKFKRKHKNYFTTKKCFGKEKFFKFFFAASVHYFFNIFKHSSSWLTWFRSEHISAPFCSRILKPHLSRKKEVIITHIFKKKYSKLQLRIKKIKQFWNLCYTQLLLQ